MNVKRSVHTADLSTTYAVDVVFLEEIQIDRSYQRPPVESEIRYLVKNFEPDAFGLLFLGRRDDGSLWCIDGQQRREAAMQLGFEMVHAFIIEGTTPRREAELFLHLNRDRTKVGALAQFKAELNSLDEVALAIETVVGECGFVIPSTTDKRWPNLPCIGAVKAAWKLGVLQPTLQLIARNWTREKQANGNNAVGCVSGFLHRFPEHDCGRLDKVMVDLPPSELFNLAGRHFPGKLKGGSRHHSFVRELLTQYNVGDDVRGLRRLPDKNQLQWTG